MLSKRSDTALEAIARGTGGTIVKLGLASGDLGTLYESKIEPLARRQHEASRLAGKAERFPLFLLTAFVLLAPRLFAGQPRLALALGLSWGSCALASLCRALDLPRCSSGWPCSRPARRPTPTEGHWGSRRSRRWPGEACVRRRPARGGPGGIRNGDRSCAGPRRSPRYNAAATLFQLKQYARARERYQEARLHADPILRTKIDYALGNTSLALG